jgi:lysine 2,3-aminomutase
MKSAFRQRYFPAATLRDWNDWKWQLRNRITDAAGLEAILKLSGNERSAIEQHRGVLPIGITPYYASLLDPDDPNQALRRTVVKVGEENQWSRGEAADPLAEDRDSPVPGLVHRYPDRVLFLATWMCPVYCRYCTRSRLVGKPGGERLFNTRQWERAIEYIAGTPAIRDVLISGGDPLLLSDERLEWLLQRLRAIPHVEFLRIGTKVPSALPQRVTPGLVRMLKKYHPLWMSIHFTHPDELTEEASVACCRLSDGGIPLGSQTVLLRGINDNADTLQRLFHGLLKMRVKPYYLYQCDPVAGTSHFRVPVAEALEILGKVRGYTTGYAVPTYVIDAPGGGGKIPLLPNESLEREGGDILLRNYAGDVFRYPDTPRSDGLVSIGALPGARPL